MAHAQTAHDAGKYYIPHGSKWPIVGAVSLFVMMLGAAALLTITALLAAACSAWTSRSAWG